MSTRGDTSELPMLQSADALLAVPGYALIRLLGEGMITRAYECRTERNGEHVVVKVLTKEAAADKALVQRIQRESRVLAGVRGPHLVRVLDVGDAPGGPWVAFELLSPKAGWTDLRARLAQKGRMPVAEALAAVRDAAKAIEAAAAVGVSHRDVKPANIFVDVAGNVKLTDFGFAAPLTRVGGPEGVYGTPAYLAPELVKGAPADVRTDIYALGATLFQLVTARLLFEGSTADVLAAHQKKPVPSIATMVPEAGIAVVDILYRLLHKEPARRPQTASEVVHLLDDAAERAGRGQAAAPAPSEPQWPTSSWPGAALGPPSVAKPAARQERVATPAPPGSGSSPFDGPSAETSSPYHAQPTGVLGTLKQMSVTEIIQMLEIGKKSARVEVSDNDSQGILQMHDGQIVHAEHGDIQGEPAVIELCQKKEGFFRIHYEKEQCPRTINRSTQHVLLEVMRFIDETGANAPAKKPARPPASTPAAARPAFDPDATIADDSSPQARPPAPMPAPASSWPSPPRQRPKLAKDEGPEGTPSGRPRPPPRRAEGTNAGKRQPVSGVGDGIEGLPPEMAARGTASSSMTMNDSTMEVDDITLREAQQQRENPLVVLSARARVVVEHATAWLEREGPKVAARFEPLRARFAKIHPRLGDVQPVFVVAGALGIVFAILIGALSVASGPGAGMGYDAAVRRLFKHEPYRVIASFVGVPVERRSAWQELGLGDAYAVVGDAPHAVAAYNLALAGGASDALALGFLASRLEETAPDDEMDLLVLWPDAAADDHLQQLTFDTRSRVRNNAIAVLAERGALSRIDVESTALLDLLSGEGTCVSRRAALGALRASGRSPAALETVTRIGKANDACFTTREVGAAYEAVKRRQ